MIRVICYSFFTSCSFMSLLIHWWLVEVPYWWERGCFTTFWEFFHVRRKIMFLHGEQYTRWDWTHANWDWNESWKWKVGGQIEPMQTEIEMNFGNGRLGVIEMNIEKLRNLENSNFHQANFGGGKYPSQPRPGNNIKESSKWNSSVLHFFSFFLSKCHLCKSIII